MVTWLILDLAQQLGNSKPKLLGYPLGIDYGGSLIGVISRN